MKVLKTATPHPLYLGDLTDAGFAKTAFGLRDWGPNYALVNATKKITKPRGMCSPSSRV
jgi:hypothetical protein